ncbi:hypothetical protein [Solimonas soli]|uniref:hypothetical protein n=1 Tax=Solimonas soli TaxID=413479 RepID=UPI0004B4A763|nr:hypothetical protein [Solimonas soli]
MRIRFRIATVAAAIAAALSTPASAGPYGDDMAKCLVSSTTSDDKTALVKWIFAVSALHPAVAPMVRITEQERDALSRNGASLFQRLMTETCRTQTQQALKYEGPSTIEHSFGVLGQVAMRELFSDPNVVKGLAEAGKYFDRSKLEALSKPQP